MRPFRVLELVKERVQREVWALEEYVVAAERHADGGEHLHAFLKFDRKVEFKPDLFDLLDPENGTLYHGNYQVAKS